MTDDEMYADRKHSADRTWQLINETTWTEENGFAGGGYTFYENIKGERCCIYQAYGSGVPAVSEEYFKAEVEKDTIRLFVNMTAPADAEPDYALAEIFSVKDSVITSVKNKNKLKLFSKTPSVYYVPYNPEQKGLRDIEEIKKLH